MPARLPQQAGAALPPGSLARTRLSALACACVLAALGLLAPPRAAPDVVRAINEARATSCARHRDFAPLRETAELDAVAAMLARGASLHAALATLATRPASASAIHLTGISDDRAITHALGGRYCSDLGDAALREVGIARAGGSLYIIVAAPLQLPAPRDRNKVERELLELVNKARARPRRCGHVAFPAAPSLTLSPLLTRVASGHSAAMAARGELVHDDPDGATSADRVRHAGYAPRVVGENIASGAATPAETVAGWLASPGHCSNIMDRRFTEMGVAYAVAPHSAAAIYWTQLLAVPRS